MTVEANSYIANVCDGEAVVIVLAGEAVGKGRPRVDPHRPHLHAGERTVRAEAKLAYAGQQAMAGRTPFAEAVQSRDRDRGRRPGVLVEAAPGRGACRTDQAGDQAGHRQHVKLICDALNRIVFDDDRQIVEVVAAKHYAAAGGMRITVEPIDARRSI